MASIKFIGNYDVRADGKFLFEILCQLRLLGVGRLVTRNEWLRKWPNQSSYIRIVRAMPTMDRWLQQGKVLGDWVYRGVNLGVFKFDSDLNRGDWRLIHKHEEGDFIKCDEPFKGIKAPSTFPLPPLQRLLARKYAEKHGLDVSKLPTRGKLKLSIDAEFAMIKDYITQVDVSEKSDSIYEEGDPKAWLDLYGVELPTKVEAWSAGSMEPIINKWNRRISTDNVGKSDEDRPF